MRSIQLLSAALLSLTLTGCPTRVVRDVATPGKAVALDKADGHAVIYDARGRGAYVSFESRGKAQDADVLMRVCAEPPPDVAADLAAESSVKQAIDASLQLKAIDAALSSSTDSNASATSTIADAATRTELVLLMRDALYRICEHQMNGSMDAGEAKQAFESVLATMRNMGQRANVALLIDALKFVVASKEPKALDQIPKLMELISNLAVLDVGMASGSGLLEAAATGQILKSFNVSVGDALRLKESIGTEGTREQPVRPTPR